MARCLDCRGSRSSGGGETLSRDITINDQVCVFLSTEEHDFLSAAIRWDTRAKWSHIGWERLSDGWTYSAMNDGKGVAWRPPNPKAEILRLNIPGMQEAFQWALSQEGKPYDQRDILGFIAGRDWGDHDGSKWICSELTASAFDKTTPLFARWTPLWHISPRDHLLPVSVKLWEVK